MKIWKKFLIIWLAAWPVTLVALLLDQHVSGLAEAMDGLIVIGAGLYALVGWAPVVLTFRDRKR